MLWVRVLGFCKFARVLTRFSEGFYKGLYRGFVRVLMPGLGS